MKKMLSFTLVVLLAVCLVMPQSFASSPSAVPLINASFDVTGYENTVSQPLPTDTQVDIQCFVLSHTNSVPENLEVYRELEAWKVSEKFDLPFEDARAFLAHVRIFELPAPQANSVEPKAERGHLPLSLDAAAPFAYDSQPFSRTFRESIHEKYLSNTLAVYDIHVSAIRNTVSDHRTFEGAHASHISGEHFSNFPSVRDNLLQDVFLKDSLFPTPLS